MKAKKNLRLKIDGNEIVCPRAHYVKEKTKQLREFGYSTLTEAECDEQVTAVLEKKELLKGLTVIDGFMRDEIVGEES